MADMLPWLDPMPYLGMAAIARRMSARLWRRLAADVTLCVLGPVATVESPLEVPAVLPAAAGLATDSPLDTPALIWHAALLAGSSCFRRCCCCG